MPSTATSFLLQTAPWKSLDVRRGNVADIRISINSIAAQDKNGPQECLMWQFRLHEYDINFKLLENNAVVQDFGLFKATENDHGDSSTTAISPSLKLQCDAQKPTMEGKFDGVKPERVYTLRWDNSYSLVRHKQVQYRFLVASKRVVAAAELAVQESQSRSQRRVRRAMAGLPLPHLAKTLAKERAMTNDERKVENERVAANIEEAVMDIVAIFTAKPDNPLHEGAARPFVLALEAVLCNGIKEEALDVWPEAPYYEFLLETQHVLRDDLGIVGEVQAGEPPPNLQHLGWNRSRAFILLALNKGILQRAFENLSKRRLVVEKYYEPRALLYKYEEARQIASVISALNGVNFLLTAYPPDECKVEDQRNFPRNLKQCAPEALLLGNEIDFQDGVQGDSSVVKFIEEDPDKIKLLEDCTVPRYILHEQPFQDVAVGRSSFELLSVSGLGAIFLAQLRVQTQDILVTLTTHDGKDLTKALLLSASDELVEVVVRFESSLVDSLAVKLDNSYSMMRSKQVHIRCIAVDESSYATAWEECLNMARSISWNFASKAGNDRCAKAIASLHRKEKADVIYHQQQDSGAIENGSRDKDDGIMGFRSSLLSKPMSYIVGGLLSSEGSVEACDQCLTPFFFYSRQYECPCCKKVVCIQCSRHHVRLHEKSPQLKVCDECFVKEKAKERARLASMKDKAADKGGERPEYATLRSDSAMDKYFKMLSFGVPLSGVVQKMTQDGTPSEKVGIFAAGPDGSDVFHVARAGRKEHLDSRALNRRDSTFRKVYWTSLETKKANETIWARVTARRKTAPIILSPQDFHELEYFFGNRTAVSASRSTENAAKKSMHSALDSRRANNISIGLSHFKAVGGADAILSALKRCDFAYLSIDRLTNLLGIAPNSVEVKRYTNFRGSRSRLESSEKFLVEMCEIPRVTEKINVMLFASQFEHQQQELSKRIRVITQACYEILQSERLARSFELVLAIGNLLNNGTELEGAPGVTLASLLKLSETKAIDQSMTLLQFIIKLIHDRGEGDVLLFVDDRSALTEARRFSNVICDSQAQTLQRGISKLEQEIKEDMIEDLKRFNEAETLRKLRFDQLALQRHRPTLALKHTGMVKRTKMASSTPGKSSDARNAILNAIRQRSKADAMDQITSVEISSDSSCTRNHHQTKADLDAIEKASRSLSAAGIDRRVSQSRDGSIQLPPSLIAQDSPAQDTPHAVAFGPVQSKAYRASGDKSSLVAAKMQSEFLLSSSGSAASPMRSTLLEAIQQRHTQAPADSIGKTKQKEPSTTNGSSQAALLAAIRQRPRNANRDMSEDNADDSNRDKQDFKPLQYQITSEFVFIMRERRMRIKAAFEDIEMELETLHSVWDGTARYLAQDTSASSSEYVFGLLNRFLLDVKVAKTLLSRKGLNFASEANAFLPHAYVGSTVVTKFGVGVITALRVADKRVEVKFPWSREAYLASSAILSVGSLVRCRQWGVGIVRKTCYDVGFCEVRFAFGYGKVRVDDLRLETSSNHEDLRRDILRSGFLIGDSVITPFGCGHVQSIRGKPDCPTTVLSVSLLASDSDTYSEDCICVAVAFVYACNVKQNH